MEGRGLDDSCTTTSSRATGNVFDLTWILSRQNETVEEIENWGWVERSSREMQRLVALGKQDVGQDGNWTSLYFDAVKPESCHQLSHLPQ